MRIVLLGCPGAGKGTQSKVLSSRFDLAHISTGDLFRAEMEKKSPLGQKVSEYVRKGMLVPDAVVIELVAAKLDESGGRWLLDGFPRTLEQAQALDKYLQGKGQGIDLVVYLAMMPEEVVRRLTGRRTCSKCGEVYNLASRPPVQEGLCDACGGELIQREDDSEATVRKRLMVYEDLTQPLTAYYRAAHAFHELDGGMPVDEVTESLSAVVENAQKAGTN